MMNKLHHELMISYHKDRLSKMPNGYFGMHRGKPVIYLTRDPADASVNSRNKRIICIDSKNGQLYYPLIKEAQEIERKIFELQQEWDALYKIKPREISYPLKHKTRSVLEKELYFQRRSGENPIIAEHPVRYKDHILRSKNEVLACQVVEQLGYEYKTEINIVTGKFEAFSPDITIYLNIVEKPVALEVDGAMDQKGYLIRSIDRKKNYIEAGFKEFRDVIFFRLNDGYSFDIDRLKALIDAALLTNMYDIVIPED